MLRRRFVSVCSFFDLQSIVMLLGPCMGLVKQSTRYFIPRARVATAFLLRRFLTAKSLRVLKP